MQLTTSIMHKANMKHVFCSNVSGKYKNDKQKKSI